MSDESISTFFRNKNSLPTFMDNTFISLTPVKMIKVLERESILFTTKRVDFLMHPEQPSSGITMQDLKESTGGCKQQATTSKNCCATCKFAGCTRQEHQNKATMMVEVFISTGFKGLQFRLRQEYSKSKLAFVFPIFTFLSYMKPHIV